MNKVVKSIAIMSICAMNIAAYKYLGTSGLWATFWSIFMLEGVIISDLCVCEEDSEDERA